jgi:prolyl-tRNA editing enzyme YbaK/EbsC (Cys-tRNA(Pro) deacylase)
VWRCALCATGASMQRWNSAAAVGCTAAQIAKSMIFCAGDRPALVVTSDANRADPDKATAALGTALSRADGR